MILSFMMTVLLVHAEPNAPVTPPVDVQKEVVYQKETVVDLSGSEVKGENQFPPAFFVTKMNTPQGKSLLAERLGFGLKNYNRLGF